MKTFASIALAATVLFSASCGILSNGTTATGTTATGTDAASTANTSVANATTGTNAGTALLGLYNQYKTDGKLDLKNINNIVNLATLASNCQGLKNSAADTGSFLTGLIAGTKKLVNQNNGQAVLSGLKDIASANLSSIKSAAATYAASALLKTAGAADTAANAAVNSVNTSSAGVTSALNSLSSIFTSLAK